MQLARFPRRIYTPHATPLEPLPRLSAALGGPEIWIKRDDLLGLAGGGNKTRKLEFLVADALAQGCDTLVTAGAMQSNHCRLTLAAAAKEGMRCRLVLQRQGHEPYDSARTGNNFLYDLIGAECITTVEPHADTNAVIAEVVAELAREGRKGYPIPVGGSNALGALGYVSCGREIAQQSFDHGLAFDRIIVTSGSAGTHGGLLVGVQSANFDAPITGIAIARKQEAQAATVHTLATATAQLLELTPPKRDAVLVRDEWLGPGYALPSEAMVEAVRMVAQLEGVLLDPVYSGKAMAGLIGLARAGELKRGERVLFLHTGGAPALFAFQRVLRRN